MTILYGIHNCDSVKKAKNWLQDNHIDYQFHDYRQQGLSRDLLNYFVAELGWEILLNKRSIRWRQLSDEQKLNLSESTALQYMLETPTLIKRPLLKINDLLIIGFNAENYQKQL